jgi:hypothetical protein
MTDIVFKVGKHTLVQRKVWFCNVCGKHYHHLCTIEHSVADCCDWLEDPGEESDEESEEADVNDPYVIHYPWLMCQGCTSEKLVEPLRVLCDFYIVGECSPYMKIVGIMGIYFTKYLDVLIPFLKDGKLVDTRGYRGTGVFYFDGKQFLKTRGEYGYFLDYGWKHGPDRYRELYNVEYIRIPKECTIKKGGKIIKNTGEHYLSLNVMDGKDQINVDGKDCYGDLVKLY